MLGRLIFGLVKGLLVGGLVGFGLVQLGQALPSAIFAYLGAAVVGIVVGLVAGKPIWQKDAKVEAGSKAVVGALLGAAMMWGARSFLPLPLPFAVEGLLPEGATFGSAAMTSLALIAALLGGFYEADNTPEPEAAAPKARIADKARIDAGDGAEAEAEAEALPPEAKRRHRR